MSNNFKEPELSQEDHLHDALLLALRSGDVKAALAVKAQLEQGASFDHIRLFRALLRHATEEGYDIDGKALTDLYLKYDLLTVTGDNFNG